MNTFGIISIVLITIILAFTLSWLWTWIQSECVGGALTNEEFEKGKRKAQIIDIREKGPLRKEYILRARNIPYTMFKYQYQEIRPDLPVYLYSDSSALTVRAARFLQKKSYKKVYWLRGGFEKWDSQAKSSEY